jgi:hypothetical protein
MAEHFKKAGLFNGPVFFYTGSLEFGRPKRASDLGAQLMTEPKALINEVIITLEMMSQANSENSEH